jgi:hypothetical protein
VNLLDDIVPDVAQTPMPDVDDRPDPTVDLRVGSSDAAGVFFNEWVFVSRGQCFIPDSKTLRDGPFYKES